MSWLAILEEPLSDPNIVLQALILVTVCYIVRYLIGGHYSDKLLDYIIYAMLFYCTILNNALNIKSKRKSKEISWLILA